MKNKYYFIFRGNGYGPFDTEKEAEKKAKLKLTEEHPYYSIYYGYVKVDECQKIMESDIKEIYSSSLGKNHILLRDNRTKLWLLKPIDSKSPGWIPPYDKIFGFVIRAETEEKARRLAQNNGGDETRFQSYPWMNRKESTCVELTPEGDDEIILSSY